MSVRLAFDNLRLAAVIAAAGLATLAWVSALAAEPNPFAQLAGSWRGSGTVSPLGSQKERVLCRVDYRLSGNDVHQDLECAGTDYKIVVNSDLTIDGDSISGRWREINFGFGGTASGLARGDEIYVRVAGDKFQGRMSIKVTNSSHTVHITQFDPGSGQYTDMADITLRR